MDGLNINATTFTTVQAAQPNVMGVLWRNVAKHTMILNDPISRLEGDESSGAAISVRRELQNAHGNRLRMTQVAGLGGVQIKGESVLENNEDTLSFGEWSVYIDFRRYAVGWTRKLLSRLAAGRNINTFTAQALGAHFAWWKCRETLLKIRNEALTARNVYYSGQVANAEALRSAHGLSTTSIQYTAEMLKFLNAMPCDLNAIAKKVGGARTVQEIWRYVFCGESGTFAPLHLDLQYVAAVNSAFVNGAGHVHFTGQFMDWLGQAVYPFVSMNGDNLGAVGSPLSPFAYLGANTGHVVGVDALVDADPDTTPTLYGSRETTGTTSPTYQNYASRPYFVDFPGYQFTYDDQETSSGVEGGVWDFADANTNYYALIRNPDDGKFGFIRYRRAGFGTNANTLTVEERWTTSNTAIDGASTVSNSAGPFAGLLTGRHPVGAQIIPCNSYGVPLDFVAALGAETACRAYGADFKPLEGKGDYGMKCASGYETDFGTALSKNARGEIQNYALIVSARQLPSWGLPAVI